MIKRSTLVKLIDANKTVYVVNNELFASYTAAKNAARMGDYVAEITGEPHSTIINAPAHNFCGLLDVARFN